MKDIGIANISFEDDGICGDLWFEGEIEDTEKITISKLNEDNHYYNNDFSIVVMRWEEDEIDLEVSYNGNIDHEENIKLNYDGNGIIPNIDGIVKYLSTAPLSDLMLIIDQLPRHTIENLKNILEL